MQPFYIVGLRYYMIYWCPVKYSCPIDVLLQSMLYAHIKRIMSNGGDAIYSLVVAQQNYNEIQWRQRNLSVGKSQHYQICLLFSVFVEEQIKTVYEILSFELFKLKWALYLNATIIAFVLVRISYTMMRLWTYFTESSKVKSGILQSSQSYRCRSIFTTFTVVSFDCTKWPTSA